MEKGVNQYWTPGAEQYYERLLATCHNFAEQHSVMSIRDLLKYDGRTKQSKRAAAQARLRIATATDGDIDQLSKLEVETLGHLKQIQDEIKTKGIKREDLEC